MSYLESIKYTFQPEDAFKVRHNCSGCGCKTSFISTGKFRVNANGSHVDVWLIYQCEKCRHSLNLTIYERKNPDKITQSEYTSFMNNDPALAFKYGTDVDFFARNHMEIQWDELTAALTYEPAADGILVDNPYKLRLPIEAMIAKVLKISRSLVKKMVSQGTLSIEKIPYSTVFRIHL